MEISILDNINKISTHTLTWSVTGVQGFCRFIKNHFNSHAHVERDDRPHRNVRFKQHFNSHAHVERDEQALKKLTDERISTHTLTWSVTSVPRKTLLTLSFQLTRSRGA